jgi:putative two-component system response regulator
MTSGRVYRKGMPEADAFAQLDRHAGTQFDPDCIAALRRALGATTDPRTASVAV